jgi:hypothetical protein
VEPSGERGDLRGREFEDWLPAEARRSGARLIPDELSVWWASLGLDLPEHGGLDGDHYLHPFPAGLHTDPLWPFERLRPEPVEPSPRVQSPSWLASFGSTRPALYATFGTEPTAADAPWLPLLEAIGDREIDALVTTGAHVPTLETTARI